MEPNLPRYFFFISTPGGTDLVFTDVKHGAAATQHSSHQLPEAGRPTGARVWANWGGQHRPNCSRNGEHWGWIWWHAGQSTAEWPDSRREAGRGADRINRWSCGLQRVWPLTSPGRPLGGRAAATAGSCQPGTSGGHSCHRCLPHLSRRYGRREQKVDRTGDKIWKIGPAGLRSGGRVYLYNYHHLLYRTGAFTVTK